MKLARHHQSLCAWMLYFSVLFAALACAIGHGQMAGLQLSGLGGALCAESTSGGQAIDLHSPALAPADCALASLFSATLLAALFGLLGLLPRQRLPIVICASLSRHVRQRWPSANPRASPCLNA